MQRKSKDRGEKPDSQHNMGIFSTGNGRKFEIKRLILEYPKNSIMKKPLHILNGVLFGLCLPFVGLVYFAENYLQGYRKKSERIR